MRGEIPAPSLPVRANQFPCATVRRLLSLQHNHALHISRDIDILNTFQPQRRGETRRKTMNATNLKDLLNALRNMSAEDLEQIDMTGLPTFGGEEPSNTAGVWSWDETSLLVGTQVGTGEFSGDFEIVSRDEDAQAIRDTLEDGAALLALGITDEDQEAVEDAHDIASKS